MLHEALADFFSGKWSNGSVSKSSIANQPYSRARKYRKICKNIVVFEIIIRRKQIVNEYSIANIARCEPDSDRRIAK
jgi:hypothetical protein